MTVVIDATHLTALRAAGVSNNPVMGIDSIYSRAGTWTTSAATAGRLADGATYTYWDAGGYPAIATYDLDAAATVNMAAIAAHNIGTIGARVAPQYWDGAAWQAFGAAQDPTDDQVIVWLGDDVSADRFRWVVADNGVATVAPLIGVGFFGRAYRFDRRFWGGYDPAVYPNQVHLATNRSGAHIIGTSVVSQGSAIQWDVQHLDPTTLYGADFAGFVDTYNSGAGFFAAWRPDDYQKAYFARRSGGPVQINNSGPRNLRSLSLQMSAYYE